MAHSSFGSLVFAFFEDYLKIGRALRPASIRSYRDALRLFVLYVAGDAHRRLSRLRLEDLTFERVLGFLRHLEEVRGNHGRTRNQRLAVLHAFFEYAAMQAPELLAVAERVAAIPSKRTPPPETHFLAREEVSSILSALPVRGKEAVRDRTLLLFLYNTGARVQEVADLRVANLDLTPQPRVHLHGKGDRWRMCPLWKETARQLALLLEQQGATKAPDHPVFVSRSGSPLTRFGIYKIVRRHTADLRMGQASGPRQWVSPHVFRHTAAVHLLEAGVEVNVIRGWLGHASLDTTNRYAEITIRTKEEALRACEPPINASVGFPRRPVWREDESLLKWLTSL